MRRFAVPLRMAEEGEASKETPAAEPAPEVSFTPPAPPPVAKKEEGFDISQFSLTIGLGVVFIGVKLLAYFGIIESSAR